MNNLLKKSLLTASLASSMVSAYGMYADLREPLLGQNKEEYFDWSVETVNTYIQDKKVDLNKCVSDGYPVLHKAIVKMKDGDELHLATARLLEAGASVLKQDAAWGETPLHYAASTGDKELIVKLVAAGADSNARRTYLGIGKHPDEFVISHGRTPLIAAVQAAHDQDNPDILVNFCDGLIEGTKQHHNNQHIFTHGAAVSYHSIPAKHKTLTYVKTNKVFIPAKGTWSSIKSWCSRNIKRDAAARDRHAVNTAIKEELKRLFAGNPGAVTALHVAAQLENLELYKILLYYGADESIKDDKNRTPLKIAKANRIFENDEKIPVVAKNHDQIIQEQRAHELETKQILEQQFAKMHQNHVGFTEQRYPKQFAQIVAKAGNEILNREKNADQKQVASLRKALRDYQMEILARMHEQEMERVAGDPERWAEKREQKVQQQKQQPRGRDINAQVPQPMDIEDEEKLKGDKGLQAAIQEAVVAKRVQNDSNNDGVPEAPALDNGPVAMNVDGKLEDPSIDDSAMQVDVQHQAIFASHVPPRQPMHVDGAVVDGRGALLNALRNQTPLARLRKVNDKKPVAEKKPKSVKNSDDQGQAKDDSSLLGELKRAFYGQHGRRVAVNGQRSEHDSSFND